eukprot:6477094-Amphidinium_carterae.3
MTGATWTSGLSGVHDNQATQFFTKRSQRLSVLSKMPKRPTPGLNETRGLGFVSVVGRDLSRIGKLKLPLLACQHDKKHSKVGYSEGKRS